MTIEEKQSAIAGCVITAATRITDHIKDLPRKRIFPKRDGLERIRRQKKRMALINIPLDAVFACAEMQKIIAVPKLKEGAEHIHFEQSDEVIKNHRVYPKFDFGKKREV